MKKRWFGFILGLILSLSAAHAHPQQDAGLADLLRKAQAEGCIALMSIEQAWVRVSNPTQCQGRTPPASTFKVLNTLIAFETGVVDDTELFPWDGKPQFLKAWEKEMTIQEAMAHSAVPVFQQIARRIGKQRMADWLEQVGYGNAEVGERVDRFWLDGPLVISPLEQIRFLSQLLTGKLPFSADSLTRLRRTLPQEKIGEARLYGKTGWSSSTKPKWGWYVGWMESQGEIMVVALRIKMDALQMAPLRQALARAALRHAQGYAE
ncbi:MAG: class D beta-lactamase [Magnetococcales bacterium]|nr:class D beta-lactamase [Magnetococcales bacterium]